MITTLEQHCDKCLDAIIIGSIIQCSMICFLILVAIAIVIKIDKKNCIIVVITEFKCEKQSQDFNFVGMTKRNVFVDRLTQVTPAKVSSVFEENCG